MNCQFDNGEILKAIEASLQNLAAKRGQAYTDKIQKIVITNMEHCRVKRYLQTHSTHTPERYVSLVANHFDGAASFIDAVQRQQSPEVWEPLIRQLKQWAVRFLHRWTLPQETRMTFAVDIAQQASLELLSAYYPYDCTFEAWCSVLVHNISRKYMRQQNKQPLVNGDYDLTESEEWLTGISVERHRGVEWRVEQAELIQQAISHLSAKQKSLITAHYFEGMALPEIANREGVNSNTIYKRHFDALTRLRKILESKLE